MSEYFKNALTLGSCLERETPSSASKLPPLDAQQIKDLYLKLNDDGFPEESVYHGHWKFQVSLFFEANLTIFFQNPSKDAVPRPWAAGARLRVACFFVGLFNTMVDYMNQGICDSVEKWRKNYLHSGVPIPWN